MKNKPGTDYTLRDFNNTDWLAFRCVKEMSLIPPGKILDLGCGSGRSTRFVQSLGNKAVGIDKSESMINHARQLDKEGHYLTVERGNALPFVNESFDALFSSWMILEEGDEKEIIRLLTECNRVLKQDSIAIIITNTAEFYLGQWLSCRVDHQENTPPLVSGQKVRVTLIPEQIELVDYFWSDQDYRKFFQLSGFKVLDVHQPLGREDENFQWCDEVRTPPYVIYRLESVT